MTPCGMMVYIVSGGGEGGEVKVWTVGEYALTRKCMHLCISYMQKLELLVYMMLYDFLRAMLLHYLIIWSDFAGELQHSFSLPQSTVISSILPSTFWLSRPYHPVSLLTHHQ